MEPAVRRARAHDLDAAARTLAAAFAEYPWTRFVIPETDYAARLLELQSLYLGYAHRHGVVGVTPDRAGVIAVVPPTAPDPDAQTVERIVALHGERISSIEAPEPSGRAWRLETLGVAPELQGRGLASALLRFALDAVGDLGGAEIALTTSDPRNVRLYERHGFTVEEHVERPERPPIWSMRAALSG